jgi:hypothetical protein
LDLSDLQHPYDGTGHCEIASREQKYETDLVADIHLQSNEQRYRYEKGHDIACDGNCCSGLELVGPKTAK